MQYTNDAIKKRMKRKNQIRKIRTTLVYIFLLPLLIYNVSLIFQAVTNPSKTPSVFGIKTYVIVSGSMQPELDIGDIVVVKEVNESELQSGDIISYREGQSVITHRIIGIENLENKKLFKTKGDSNNTEDFVAIAMSEIEGKVINSISGLGKIALMLQDKVVIIFIMIVFYAYFVRSDKVMKRKEERRIKRLEYEKRRLENENKKS